MADTDLEAAGWDALSEAARRHATAKELRDSATNLAQRYAIDGAVADAIRALLDAANRIIGVPSHVGDFRRAMMDDPVLHAVFTAGQQEGYRRARAEAA
jgi:hypothetical protein